MNKQGFAIICFGLVVVLCAAFFLSDTLSQGLCENKVEREFTSPNGQLKAVVFNRNCGSDTSQVSILGSGDSLPGNKAGNVLQQDHSPVDVTWEGDTTVLLRCDSAPKTYIKEEQFWVVKLPLPVQVTVKYQHR